MKKATLKIIVEENSTYRGCIFDLFIQSLIIVSLVSFSIETLPGISSGALAALRIIETLTVAIFTIEYILRLYVANDKKGFVFSFYGIIDALAILPFYFSTGIDLRSIRVIRLLRLFRTLKLVRYSKAIQRFGRAFRLAREELILFFFVSLIVFYFAAVGIYYFENAAQPKDFASISHSLWWAIITLTTVGYGDVYPVTVGGRVFTFFILLIGLGTVAIPSGIMATALSKARADEV